MRLNWRILLAMIALLAMVATACASDEDGAATTDDGPTDEAVTDQADTDEPTEAETEDEAEPTEDEAADGEAASGTVEIDGSSTVGPLTDAIAEELAAVNPDITVNLGISGTGGGFERFCGEGSTDISNASRPIEQDEIDLCAENGIEYTEVRVGTDALTMVTNTETGFLECLTSEELITLWGPENSATTWDEVNPDFPAEPITIFAPGADSGTYDFFNETILEPAGIEDGPRQDFNASEDDNIISQGIQGTVNSWGYFGFAYYINNTDGLTPVAYDAGDGCVEPSVETAQDDSYGLTRPLFIYVNNESLQDPAVAEFVTFYLDTVDDVIEDVGYIGAPQELIDEARAAVEANL